MIVGTCTHGDVRLRGSRTLNRGRVEICYNSIWGTVSSYGWSANDAMVVCKQLGFFPYCKLLIVINSYRLVVIKVNKVLILLVLIFNCCGLDPGRGESFYFAKKFSSANFASTINFAAAHA